jgi:hypothetical protein
VSHHEPALSVVIGTHGWPDPARTLELLREQAIETGTEVIVVDSGRTSPPADALWSGVRWIQRPGAALFELRAIGFREARGSVVAGTEDHCDPALDWCRSIIAAHATHPDADVIGGVVRNATPYHAEDRASFLIGQGAVMPPLANGPTPRVAGGTNASYKRASRPGLSLDLVMEPVHLAALRAAGARFVADDSIRVQHRQSEGKAETTRLHFHNGRSVAGTRRRIGGARVAVRALLMGGIVPYRTLRTLQTGRAKGVPLRQLAADAPAVTWLQYVSGAGEILGYAAGPGDSPARLR